MGPTWGPSGTDRTQVGPMLVPWTLLSGYTFGGNEFSCISLSWICDIHCNVLAMNTGICTWHSDNRNHFKYMYCFHLTHSGDESMDSGFAGSRVFSSCFVFLNFIFSQISSGTNVAILQILVPDLVCLTNSISRVCELAHSLSIVILYWLSNKTSGNFWNKRNVCLHLDILKHRPCPLTSWACVTLVQPTYNISIKYDRWIQ